MRFELLRARKNAGMTQQQIAERVGIPRYKYSKIENGGQKSVDVEMARTIARTLNVSLEDIFLPDDAQKMRKMQTSGGAA